MPSTSSIYQLDPFLDKDGVLREGERLVKSNLSHKLNIKKKKLYGPFLWIGFNCLKATATSRRQFTFYHSVPRNSWYSFYRPQKDERLSRPWSHPVVLSTGPLDWQSSALTTRPLLHCSITQKMFWKLPKE